MKCIQKCDEPQGLIDWKSSFRSFGGTPTYAELRNPQKTIVKQSLIDEQGKICCYCGIRIDMYNTHIEHLVPQSVDESLQVEYSNLLASCEGENRLVHCGHNKENWYDPDKLISPLDTDCEQHFAFTYDGRIIPAYESEKTDASAETISRLGLDTEKLNSLRGAAIEGILFLPDLTVEEIDRFLLECRRPNEQGELLPFASTLQFVLQLEKDRMLAE